MLAMPFALVILARRFARMSTCCISLIAPASQAQFAGGVSVPHPVGYWVPSPSAPYLSLSHTRACTCTLTVRVKCVCVRNFRAKVF